MSDVVTSSLVPEIWKMRYQIVQACGLGLPFYFPENKPEEQVPIRYGSKQWLRHFRTPQLVQVFSDIAIEANLPGDGNIYAGNCHCVHILRVVAFFLRSTWITRKEAHTSVLKQCADVLHTAMCVATGEVINRKETCRMIKTQKKLTEMVKDKAKNSKSIYRATLLNRKYSSYKSINNSATSTRVTKQWTTSVQNIGRKIQPDVNYMRRLAVQERILYNCMMMTDGQLLSFNEMLRNAEKVHPDLLRSNDHLQLTEKIFKMGKRRLCTKLLEVNQRHCRCFAKCVGPLGDSVHTETRVWEMLKSYSGIMICMACRLATNVENRAVERPRRTVSDINPMIQSCSVCASPLKYLQLLVQDFAVTRKGRIHIKYSHRFYTSNSVNMMAEITGSVKTGTRATYCGMCYDGKRTCTKLFTDVYPSQTKCRPCKNRTDHVVTDYPPCTDVKFWFRCNECRKCDDDYGALFSLGLISSEAQPTCLRRYFTDCTFQKKRLCRGCKIAASCSHLNITLYNMLQKDNMLAVVKRVKRLGTLQHWLVRSLSWTGDVETRA